MQQQQDQYFNPTHQSRYEQQPQDQQQFDPNQQERDAKLNEIQNNLQNIKNQIYNSQRKQDQLQQGNNQQGFSLNGQNKQSPQQYWSNKNNQQANTKPYEYYQSQMNDNQGYEMQSYNSNFTQQQQQQQQTLSFYGLNKNNANPFNQNVDQQDLETHKNEALSHYYNPQNAQSYNNKFNGQLKYQGIKNTGFSYDDFEQKAQQQYLEKIYKVQERDFERSRLGTHPHQLKQKEEQEMKNQLNNQQKGQQDKELSAAEQEKQKEEQLQYDLQISQLKQLLHNHRLISFSGTTLQIILYFFMYFMTSNNVEENDLAQKFTFVHILITVYFLMNQCWNFNIYKRIYWDFEEITNSWFSSFMLFFSFLNVIVYLVSCVYYIIMFSQIKGDTDNLETRLLNYFVILISTVNIFQLLYSTYTTWNVRYPPKNHQYYILD